MLAGLDPAGVGRDPVFSHDGQMHFTLFPLLLTGAIRWLGLSHGAEAVAFAAVLAWFAAISVLALTLAEGRARWIIMSFIVLAPSSYANGFHFGEALALPRPFAEALVILGCSAILRRNFWLAGALMLGAALLHPIMALPGIGILFLGLVERNRRWLWAVPGSLLALGMAAGLHMPLMQRVLVTMDVHWWAIEQKCSPQIFPLLWRPYAYAQVLTQTATLIVAIWSLERRLRSLFLHVLIVALSGLGIAALCGDLIRNELVVQAQLWRALWIAAALAPAALGLMVAAAKDRPPQAWIVPALLATAWTPTSGLAKLCLCLCALLLCAIPEGKLAKIPERYAKWAFRLLILFGATNLLSNDIRLIATHHLALGRWHIIAMKLNMVGWFLALALFFILTGPGLRKFRSVGLVVAVSFAVVSLGAWDSRSAFRKQVDLGRPVAPFMAVIAKKPGSVYWVGGKNEAWFLLRRANWSSGVLSWPSVFSRRQAVQWQNRAERVVKSGFEPAGILAPLDKPLRLVPRLPLTSASIAAFCAAADAPPWVVWQMAPSSAMLAAGVKPRATWQLQPDITYALMACHAGTAEARPPHSAARLRP
ncbi:MAG: hypothetical protein KGQ37_10960 [Hyphomicrobiales bacterium]|nr:hypothetical protein [Hyphomicrobiales bacterium]